MAWYGDPERGVRISPPRCGSIADHGGSSRIPIPRPSRIPTPLPTRIRIRDRGNPAAKSAKPLPPAVLSAAPRGPTARIEGFRRRTVSIPACRDRMHPTRAYPARTRPTRACPVPTSPIPGFRVPISSPSSCARRQAALWSFLSLAIGSTAFGQAPAPQLYYEMDGRGPAVVFIEDWAQDTSTWFRVLPHLRPGRQLVRYDLRGQGRSEAPVDGDYSLDAHVRDLFRLLDGLAIDRAHLVASGLGARVAIEAAAGSPERVRSLTLINPHTAWTSSGIESWHRFTDAYRQVGRPSLGEYAALLVDRWFGILTVRREPWLVPFYDLVLRRQDPEALIAALEAWLATDLAFDADMAREIPLLVIRGGRAGIVEAESRLRSAFPRYGAVVLPDSGHLPQLDDPAALGKAIAQRIDPSRR